MKLHHLLNIDLVQFQHDLRCVFTASNQGQQRSKVHQISSIYSDIYTKEQVNTRLVPSDCAGVLDIIDHQSTVVNDLAERSNVKD